MGSRCGRRFCLAVCLLVLGVAGWGMVPGPARAGQLAPYVAPDNLDQLDDAGSLPVGELLGSAGVTLRFTIDGPAGELVVPQVELRRTGEAFVAPNLEGAPLLLTGVPQTVSLASGILPAYSGYHWRARVVGAAGASAWTAFGSNSDEVSLPGQYAAADFYNLYEPLDTTTAVPWGFDSLVRIGQLPVLHAGVQTHQVSSFDRTEGNNDGGSAQPGLESFFYREGDAEVILEVSGPGQINRLWLAESNDPGFANTRVQFYFDGATQPGLDVRIVDLLAGTQPPFVYPLVLGPDHSSGGWVSYVPIPFRQGIKVRLLGPHVHYQVTYQVFSQPGDIQTFSGQEDYTLAQHLWSRLGEDPKPTRGNLLVDRNGSVAPGATVVLADLAGPGVVQSLKLQIPQLEPSILGTAPLSDTVRAHQDGASQFQMTTSFSSKDHAWPAAPTRLRLRRSCARAPQTAVVSLGGVVVGTWVRAQGSDRYRWCDDTYALPVSAASAPYSITLQLASTASPQPWAEARYWLEQQAGGSWQVVDTLDVGNAAAEAAHAYGISGQVWAGAQTNTYAPQVTSQPASEALLRALRLRITADDAAVPDVDVPLGAFFGSGVGETNLASLLAGMIPQDDTLYSFWPLPYAQHLRIELVNTGSAPVTGFSAQVAYRPRTYPAPGTAIGYFRVVESLSRPTVPGTDHPLVSLTAGAGRVVGLHLLVHSGNEGLIEGDERWHVDGLRTPGVRGTGTEDVFNGGWYYNRGRVLHAVHGVNSTRMEGWIDQYRWYVGDYIPFADGLAGGIEHGGSNDLNADYSSWVFYYHAPQVAPTIEDVVDVSDAASLAQHQAVISGPTSSYSLTASFEGDDDTLVTDSGIRLGLQSAFTATLHVDPAAAQVVLRRRYDQGVDSERLRVWVDGVVVGEWLDGGRNSARRWRESEFLLPPAHTQGRETIRVRLEPVAWAGSQGANLVWLAARSLDAAPLCGWDVNCDGVVDIVDVQLVAAAWQVPGAYRVAYDHDRDGDVDIVDVARQVTAWAGE